MCGSELRGFQSQIAGFEARGVRVAAISADPPETNLAYRRELGLSYPLLSDPSGDVLRRYDLLHTAGGPGGADISRPAEFLVDAAGVVRWANLTKSAVIRARPEDVLKAADGLAPTPAK
jgi:peroxiredoxin Q/BCP